MPASTRRFASPLLFKWDANWGLDSQNRLWALSGNRIVTATFDRGGTVGAASSLDVNGRVYVPGYKTPRWYHDPSNPSLGPLLLLEGSRTNLLTYGRDLTNAAWTATNVTVAATTGADGVASSGSRLTATAGNGTVIRAAALVHGSAAYTGSFFIKRITGTGNVDITLDNGATWTTVTVTAAYTQLGKTQTLANSQFGIRLVTSGDVVDVDFCQNELGAFRSSAIATTTAAVTRAADALSFPFLAPPQAMTVYADFVEGGGVTSTTADGRVFQISNAAQAAEYWYTASNAAAQKYFTGHLNAGSQRNSQAAAAPTIGQRCELRSVLNTDGSVILGQSIASGAEAVAATSAAEALGSAFSGAILYVGSAASGASSDFLALRSLKVAAGVQTLATMRQL